MRTVLANKVEMWGGAGAVSAEAAPVSGRQVAAKFESDLLGVVS